MQRNEFLKMCQKVSVLPKKTMHNRDVQKDLQVWFNGKAYYPTHLEIKFDDGAPKNIAVLHELEANCVLCVPLEKVKLTKTK